MVLRLAYRHSGSPPEALGLALYSLTVCRNFLHRAYCSYLKGHAVDDMFKAHRARPRIEIKVVMEAGLPAKVTASTTVDNESVMEALSRFITLAQTVSELEGGR